MITAGIVAAVAGVAYAVAGRHAPLPPAGSSVLSVGSGASGETTGPGAAAGSASGIGSAAGPVGGPPSATPPSATPSAPTGSPSADPTTDAPPGPPPAAAGSQGTTSVSVTVGATAGGLGVADPIGYLEGLRTRIQSLAALGPATLDPVAAGDLQNLVLDLENSVVAYQQNGGAAHLQEIKDKIAAFDARLALLVSQGRISQGAADELSAYLQQLSPA
jgi:hypothetical protein